VGFGGVGGGGGFFFVVLFVGGEGVGCLGGGVWGGGGVLGGCSFRGRVKVLPPFPVRINLSPILCSTCSEPCFQKVRLLHFSFSRSVI